MKKETLILIGVGLLIVLGGGVVVYNQTRGLRNNNPGNIRQTGTTWQGMAPEQTDSAFVQFVSPEYGIRALGKVLLNYYARGLNTVASIISTYAPPSENDTGAYANAVARELGVNLGTIIDVPSLLHKLIPAIVRHENGMQPYSAETLARGIALV